MEVKPHWWDEPVQYCHPDARFVSLHDDLIVIRDADGEVLGQTRYSRDTSVAAAEVRRQGFEVSPWKPIQGRLVGARQASTLAGRQGVVMRGLLPLKFDC